MATKTWTDTADFSNGTTAVNTVNKISLRHFGCKNGESWNTTDHPDTSTEFKSGWYTSFNTVQASSVSFVDGNLSLAISHDNGDAGKWFHYSRLVKGAITSSSTKTVWFKQKYSNLTADGLTGLFTNFQNAFVGSIFFHFTVAGKPYLRICNDVGGMTSANGDDADVTTDTYYWHRLKIDGSKAYLDIYSTEPADFDNPGNGDRTDIEVAYGGYFNTSLNYAGWHNYNGLASSASTQTIVVDWIDGDVCEWTTRHLGWKDCQFDWLWPNATGQTHNGWTMTNSGGATSAVAISDGDPQFTIKQEASAAKKFHYWTATAATVSKTTEGSIGFSFLTATNPASTVTGIGFYNSSSDDGNNTNCLFATWYNTASGVFVQTGSSGGSASATAGALNLSNSTQYWARLTLASQHAILKIYGSEENYDADESALVSIDKDISGWDGTCDRFGIHNVNYTGTYSETVKVYFIESSASIKASWFDACTAQCVDQDFETITTLDYSSFTATESGTVLYDLRKKVEAEGAYAADTNSGNHYTIAQIQALDDEDVYGIGLVAYLDPDADPDVETDAISINYSQDDIAPGDLDYMRVYVPDTKDWYVVAFEDATDTGGSGLKENQVRISDDGGSTWYAVDWDATNHKFTVNQTPAYAGFRNTNTTDAADVYCEVFNLDISELGFEVGTTLTVQMRGVDNNDNEGGWATATSYGVDPDYLLESAGGNYHDPENSEVKKDARVGVSPRVGTYEASGGGSVKGSKMFGPDGEYYAISSKVIEKI